MSVRQVVQHMKRLSHPCLVEAVSFGFRLLSPIATEIQQDVVLKRCKGHVKAEDLWGESIRLRASGEPLQFSNDILPGWAAFKRRGGVREVDQTSNLVRQTKLQLCHYNLTKAISIRNDIIYIYIYDSLSQYHS